MDHHPARTFLFAPAHRSRPLTRALSGATGADVVIVDLEDGIPATERHAAADALRWLAASNPGPVPALCRIRSGPARRIADLRLVPDWFSGVLLAGAEDAHDVRAVSTTVSVWRSRPGVWLMVESARGVEQLPQMLAQVVPVAGIVLGTDGPLADPGVLDHTRGCVVRAAEAAGVRQVVDGPDPRVGPTTAFRDATCRARDLGFTGRAAVDPAQLAVIEEVYTERPRLTGLPAWREALT